jgi:tetratricopeptide (TPR) repeat protein
MSTTRPRALLTLVVAFSLWSGFDLFQTRSGAVEEGNRLLRAGKLKEALAAYQRAAKELPDEPGVQYNLGIALHRLGQLEKARDALSQATLASPRELRQKAFYNLGNAQFDLKKYKEAAAAYTRALQLDPGHTASRWNLELALRRIQEEKKKKEQEKKQKQDKKDQKQDKKDQKQEKKDQKQDPKQGADEKRPADKKKDTKDPAEEKNRAKKEQQRKQPEKRDGAKPGQKPPEMDNVLDALDRNDRNLQRRRARMVPGGGLTRPSKDW